MPNLESQPTAKAVAEFLQKIDRFKKSEALPKKLDDLVYIESGAIISPLPQGKAWAKCVETYKG